MKDRVLVWLVFLSDASSDANAREKRMSIFLRLILVVLGCRENDCEVTNVGPCKPCFPRLIADLVGRLSKLLFFDRTLLFLPFRTTDKIGFRLSVCRHGCLLTPEG